MAQVVGAGFDISGLEKAAEKADKSLRNLQKTSDEVTKSINKAFESVAQGGIQQLSQSIESLNKGLQNLGKSSGGKGVAKSMENISKSTDNAVDKVNRMTTLMQTITDGGRSSVKNGAIESLNQQIKASMEQLDQLRQKMNFYTKGEGRKALDANVAPDMSKTMEEANALRVKIELLQREREHLQANAALRERSGAIARQQERDTNWGRMEQEKRNIQKKNEEERIRQEREANIALSKERIDQLTREHAMRMRVEKMIANTQKQNYAQREKELNDLFINSTKGAIGYGQDTRGQLRSVDAMRDAISKMEEAQRKVNTSTKSGQKEYNLLTREIMKSKAELAKLTGEGRNLQNSLGPLGNMMSTIFGVQAIRGFVNKMVQVRGEFEQINKAMQVIIGNKEQANRIWDQTVALAVKSPFSVQELVRSTRQLAAYRIETEKLYETNKMLADISAGLGVDMNRLILAFGQVKAASFLRGTELRQFTEAGVPMLEELAKHFTELYGRVVTVDQAFEMISKRQVSFKDVEQVLKNMTSEGGVFFNMQEQMADTVRGKISNLKDQISLMFNEIGQDNEGIIHGTINLLSTLVKNWRYVAAAIKTVLVAYAAYQINATIVAMATGKFALAANALAAGETKAFMATNKLTRALARLKVAFTGASVGGGFLTMIPALAISAISAIAMFSDASEEASEEEKRRAEEMEQNVKQIAEHYEQLAKTVNKIKEAFDNAVDSKNLTDQKIQLQKLIEIANEEYHMRIIVDVDGLSAEEITSKVKEIEGEMQIVNAFSKSFATTIEKSFTNNGLKTMASNIEQNLTKFINERKSLATILNISEENVPKWDKEKGMSDYIDNLETLFNSKYENVIYRVIQKIAVNNPLKEEWIYKGRGDYKTSYKDPINWQQYSDLYGVSLEKIEKWAWDARGKTSRKDEITKLGELADSFALYFTDRESILSQFKNVIEKLDIGNVKDAGLLREALETSIKGMQETHGLSNALTNELLEYAGSFFKIDDIDPVEKEQLYSWQQRFNDYLSKLRKASQAAMEKEFGKDSNTWSKSYFNAYGALSTLPMFDENNMDMTRKRAKEMINGNMETAKEIIDAYEKGVGEIGAYTENEYKIAKIEYEQYLKAFEFFGGDDKGAEKTAKKKLQEQIKLLEEMHKKYLELKKTYGDDKAQSEVRKAYEDTFTEVFKDTGITFDAYKTFGGFKDAAGEAGAEAGTALTDEMQAKIDELTQKGVYIRSADSAAEAFTKEFEKAILKAKDVEGLGKGFTIGYGEYDTYKDTGEKIKKDDTLTQEEAAERFSKVILPQYVKGLNAVLDVNKDLIFTQEQYNALLDMSYQGGVDEVQKLIKYARDEEEALKHVSDIRAKFATAYGEEEAEKRFGESFVNQLKEAENIYERMALLISTMNLTVGGEVRKDMGGMLSRTEARTQLFKGDLDIAKQLEDALVTMDSLDFMSKEGMAKALGRLKELAKKAGPEVEKLLSKTISGYEAEIGLKLAQDADKELRKSVQDLFDRNSITKELKKLQVPPDLAKALFGVDFLDNAGLKSEMITTYTQNLAEDAQKAVQEILAKGSSKITKEEWAKVAKYIGDDQITQAIQKDLEKVEDLEEKSLKERMKKYVEYSRKSLGQAGEIRLKQLLKMQDIEETFAWKEGDTEETKLAKTEEGVRALDKAVQDANEAMMKLQWEEFRKSETFTSLFDDLDTASDKVLEDVITRLEEFKKQGKDLPIDQMKEVDALLRKAKRAKDADDNPWVNARDLRKSIKNDGRTVDDANIASATAEQEKARLEKELQMMELINQQRNLGTTDAQLEIALGEKYKHLLKETLDLDKQRGKIAEQQGIIDKAQDRIQDQKDLIKAYEAQRDAMQEIDKMAQDLYNSFKELYEAMGQDDAWVVFADAGMEVTSMVLQMVALQAELNAARKSAEGFGLAMNTAMGVIGWIVMAVQILTKAITAVAEYEDKLLVDEIEKQAREIEGLNERYEDLEEAMDKAYSTEQVERLNAKLKVTTESLIEAQKAAIAAQEARKNSDKVGSDNWKELQDMKKELEEMEDTLAESLEESFSKVTDGLFDSVHDVAKEFTDAWYEAFKETGNGLKGLEENFDEMFANLVKHQASMQISGTFASLWKSELEKYINEDDTRLSAAEAKEWEEKVRATLPDLSDSLKAFFDSFGDIGTGTGLSELQKGIQGMSESTSQVLEAYLNSVKMYVATISADTNSQLNEVKAIHTLLSSVTMGGHARGGQGIKVFADFNIRG